MVPAVAMMDSVIITVLRRPWFTPRLFDWAAAGGVANATHKNTNNKYLLNVDNE